ncbi:MAG: S8 family serine peptidase [Acidobacteriota bacterium]
MLCRSAALALVLSSPLLPAQTHSAILSSEAPGHLVVVYRNGQLPANSDALIASTGASPVLHLSRFGLATLRTTSANEATVTTTLLRHPEVAAVLHDRYVTAHLLLSPIRTPAFNLPTPTLPSATPDVISQPNGLNLPRLTSPTIFIKPDAPSTDTLYNSPAGWAVIAAGGYGARIPGGPAIGPWNTSLGAGVRIAVIDSGVDPNHPDISPNLVLNLSEVDQSASTGEPSPCDNGSPADQQGHGTFVASLALGAIQGGNTIGVAPQASLLNIKVLERLPAAAGTSLISQCENGQASGLLSWVLKGIQDAVANHADIIALSLGSIVDLSTGDGAGWKAQFDAVTYAAQQSGSTLIAAAGNDGLDLSNGRFIELPAQARGVLAVTAATNPACAENLTAGATCTPGPITRPYYSNHGATLNAISAPGGNYPQGPGDPTSPTNTAISGFITGACSTGLPNTTDGLPSNPNQSFGCFNQGHAAYTQAMGTSASAALVAGAAALLHAANPTLTPAQIIQTLRTSATPTTTTDPQLNLPAALTGTPSPHAH